MQGGSCLVSIVHRVFAPLGFLTFINGWLFWNLKQANFRNPRRPGADRLEDFKAVLRPLDLKQKLLRIPYLRKISKPYLNLSNKHIIIDKEYFNQVERIQLRSNLNDPDPGHIHKMLIDIIQVRHRAALDRQANHGFLDKQLHGVQLPGVLVDLVLHEQDDQRWEEVVKSYHWEAEGLEVVVIAFVWVNDAVHVEC